MYPPRLMYKIFTHRPVTDICAFCPRDYSGVALAAAQTSNVGQHSVQHVVYRESQSDHLNKGYPAGWYRRHENNSWRPVDTSAVDQSGQDCIINRRSQPIFHYSTRIRAAKKLRKQRIRRREWLVALYRYSAAIPG